LLAGAYRRSLEVACENGITSIAFPAISTGVFGYPVYEAAPIALRTICDFTTGDHRLTLIRLVLYSADTAAVFVDALTRLVEARDDLSVC
jgi:O-acetyl-ADP-ribose deacetylase (regulator of RNase III)